MFRLEYIFLVLFEQKTLFTPNRNNVIKAVGSGHCHLLLLFYALKSNALIAFLSLAGKLGVIDDMCDSNENCVHTHYTLESYQ